MSRCDSIPVQVQLVRTVWAVHVVLGINLVWWLYYMLTSIAPGKFKASYVGKTRVAKWWHAGYPYLRLVNGLVSLVMMWVFIGLFYQYRAVIARNSGPAYEDGKWTFGQVLSMATWAPVAVDLVAVYLCEHLLTPLPCYSGSLNLPVVGAEKGLSSKLTRRYKVVAVPFQGWPTIWERIQAESRQVSQSWPAPGRDGPAGKQ